MTTEIPYGFCQCGCGAKTTIRDSSNSKHDYVKGEPIKFIHGHNMRSRGHHELYSAGKFRHKSGYIWAKCDSDHPRKHNGYVLEHVLVAEKKLGRLLTPEEQVHHDNEIKDDNRPENLIVFKNCSEHAIFHARLKALRACGHPDWRKCHFCHKYDSMENLSSAPQGKSTSYFHRECRTIANRRYALTRKN